MFRRIVILASLALPIGAHAGDEDLRALKGRGDAASRSLIERDVQGEVRWQF